MFYRLLSLWSRYQHEIKKQNNIRDELFGFYPKSIVNGKQQVHFKFILFVIVEDFYECWN